MTVGKNRPLKVGFDLDGVLLYNPARIIRPVVKKFKRRFIKKRSDKFFVPKGPLQEKMWQLFHKSSFIVAPGFEEIRELVEQGKIEAYLITARFDHLKPDLDRWVKKMGGEKIFKQVYHNRLNQQPHLYKAEMVNKLKLDLFVEDNWDIVRHLRELRKQKEHSTRVFWITNLFDKKIDYKDKHLTLKSALAGIKDAVNKL